MFGGSPHDAPSSLRRGRDRAPPDRDPGWEWASRVVALASPHAIPRPPDNEVVADGAQGAFPSDIVFLLPPRSFRGGYAVSSLELGQNFSDFSRVSVFVDLDSSEVDPHASRPNSAGAE